MIETNPITKSKLTVLLDELKRFNVKTILVLQNKLIINHLSTKLIVNDLDIDEAFGSMHHSVITKMKNSVSKDCIVKTIVEHGIKIFEC